MTLPLQHWLAGFAAALLSLALAGPAAAAKDGEDAAASASRRLNLDLGIMRLGEQRLALNGSGSDEDLVLDFSDLPALGLQVELPLPAGGSGLGFEIGGSLAWKSDDIRISGRFGGDGGSVGVAIDNSLFLGDICVGINLRFHPLGRAQVLLAGGPLLAYVRLEPSDSAVESLDSAGSGATLILRDGEGAGFSLGYYLRAGIDVPVSARGRVGIGVRYSSASLDFDDAIGEVDIDATHWYLSFTTYF